MVPPFKPTVSSETDTSNVDVSFTTELPLVTPTPVDAVLVDDDAFAGFTYEGSYKLHSTIDGETYEVTEAEGMEIDWAEDEEDGAI